MNLEFLVLSSQKDFPHINGLPEQRMLRLINDGLRHLDSQKAPLQEVANIFGIREYRRPVLAPHPDFAYLRQSENMTEEHHIVSLFVDVKGSTAMFKRLSKEQIHGIVNIVVRAATHTLALFGGHPQRIMFDGVFFYFGGKSIPPQKAVMDAVNAATMFCYFMENELPALLEEYSLEPVYSRIGIDFGDTGDVLWGLHGTLECGELSTTSLHTSLAAKMQHEAKSNGIVLGQNMYEKMDYQAKPFCKIDPSNRYIFQARNFNYTQYHFDWDQYIANIYKQVSQSGQGKTSPIYPSIVSKSTVPSIERGSNNTPYTAGQPFHPHRPWNTDHDITE